MTVRRIDSYRVKPGQERAYFALAAEFNRHIGRHRVGPTTVVRISSGGPDAGQFHAFADFESMEAYGRFIDDAVADEDLQATFARFFDGGAPGHLAGSDLLVQIGAFGAEEPLNTPGVAAIVRTWAVAPGHQSVVTDNIRAVSELYGDTNGHWNVWDVVAAGRTDGPQMLTAAVFPNMTELGAYSDDMRNNPDVAELIRETMEMEHAPTMLGASIVRAVDY